MSLTIEQAEILAERARAKGEYGEITIRDCGDGRHVVTGRKVVNGQGIGRMWSNMEDAPPPVACYRCGTTANLGIDGARRYVCDRCLYLPEAPRERTA